MVALLIVLALVLVAVAAPFLGTDTSDARSERARPEAGWFPADSDASTAGSSTRR